MYKVNWQPSCLNELEKYGTLEEFDIALTEITYALERNPSVFNMSPQYPQWIGIVTQHYKTKRRVLPSLRMYGFIDEDKKRVLIFLVRMSRSLCK